jgi:hypothetical protein
MEEAKASFGEQKLRLEGEVKKYTDQHTEAEKKALAVQKELDSHQSDAANWLADLNKINSALASKYLPLSFLCRHTCCTGILSNLICSLSCRNLP